MTFLAAPDPSWPMQAKSEIERWQDVLGPKLIAAFHIGSTAVPGLVAKPIIDLLPVVESLEKLDALNPAITALGYEAMGTYGISGRRYFRKSAANGRRLIHAHAFAIGDPAIRRHVAFRDLLRSDPDISAAYQTVKIAADIAADGDMDLYINLKDGFIQMHEALALQTLP